jgi:hypothetical protein
VACGWRFLLRPVNLTFFFTSIKPYQSHYWYLLSGTDGTLGLKTIKDYGGITWQDEESAAYTAMPIVPLMLE